MKTIITTILFLGISLGNLLAQELETIDLTLTFNITKYNEGVIYVALYNSEESFMNKAYMSLGTDVKDNIAEVKFENIKKGTYSFSFYHDVNSNKKLDTNFLGIPKEPYGFSNNQAGRFGPPSFKESNISITQNTRIKINTK